MERAKKIGVSVISIATLVAMIWLPLSEHTFLLWWFAVTATAIGDVGTTSLFGRFEVEEQQGYTRMVCGPQPSFRCMALTRIPIFFGAGLLYFIWSETGVVVSYKGGELGAELIPLMLTVAGVFAFVWNVSQFIATEDG